MGNNEYEGVRAASNTSIEIDFYYQNQRCKERIKLKPTTANIKKAFRHRAAILNSIENGTFDYSVTFPNSKNALKFAPSKYTIDSYLTEWLSNKKPTIKASTYKDYKKTIENLIIPQFKGILLHDLKRSDVRQWAATFTCSNKRTANILSPFRAALQDACYDELIDINPLYNWQYKRNEAPTKDTINPFTSEEQHAIISAASGPIRNQCIVFFWTGLRTSELVALEWDDIDFDRKVIKITKALTQASESEETPKTASGAREVEMLPPVEQALKDQKQHTLLPNNKVFHDPRSNTPWVGDQAIRKTVWIPLLKKADVEYRNPYQTRHTFASMMLSSGEPLPWVSNQLGHSTVLITAKVYAKWLPKEAGQGMKAVDTYGQYLVNIEKPTK